MEPEIPGPIAAKRGFWRRWVLDPVVRQLTQGVSPDKIALSIAVGSVVAIFPILGTTTTLCVIAGVALGLNQPIIQGVNALCTFIYFPLLVAFVRLGDALAGRGRSSLDVPLMIALLRREPREFLHQFGSTALHGMIGWAVVAPVWVAAVYLLALRPLRATARRLGRRRDSGL